LASHDGEGLDLAFAYATHGFPFASHDGRIRGLCYAC